MGKSESLKTIEKHLHPWPKIKGFDILHRHQGQFIYFDAWDGNDKLNNRKMRLHRQYVLNHPDIYKEYSDELTWLVDVEYDFALLPAEVKVGAVKRRVKW